MQMKKISAVVITVLFASVPLIQVMASGSWLAGSGEFEPSTMWDTSAYMFQGPSTTLGADGKGVDQIYFNGLIIETTGVTASHQNNIDGGNIMSAEANFAVAILGFWRDCNEDGYVGARAAPSHYTSWSAYLTSVEPVNTDICPIGSAYYPINEETGQPNGFVDEFRWIGWSAGCDSWKVGCPGHDVQYECVIVGDPTTPDDDNDELGRQCLEYNDGEGTEFGVRSTSTNLNDVTDNRSRVWGDWSPPGERAFPKQGIVPLPRGTTSDSDGTLKWVDDAMQGAVSAQVGQPWTDKPNVGGGCDAMQPHPEFAGEGTQCGLWPVYQAKRLNNDSSCYNAGDGRPEGCWEPTPIVRTWKYNEDDSEQNPCDGGARQDINNPTDNSRVRTVAVPEAEPSVNMNLLADGSFAGTLKHQERALNATIGGDGRCGRGSVYGADDCTYPEDLECESQNAAPVKIDADFPMTYTTGASLRTLAAAGFDGYGVDSFGVGGADGWVFGPGWFSGIAWTGRPPRAGWGSVNTAFATYYADVSSDAFANNTAAAPATAFPGGGQDKHVYGEDFCAAFTYGTSAIDAYTNWECDIKEWERHREASNEHDSPFEDTGDHTPSWKVIGDPYDLRDVDCFDNSVSSNNPYTGSALAGVRGGIADCSPFAS